MLLGNYKSGICKQELQLLRKPIKLRGLRVRCTCSHVVSITAGMAKTPMSSLQRG